MKLGPRARVAVSHVARGHQLRSSSLRAAWQRLGDRRGPAVANWKKEHGKFEGDPTKGQLRSLAQLRALRKLAQTDPTFEYTSVRYEGNADYALRARGR